MLKNQKYLEGKEIGEGFWEVVKDPYLNRDLNRSEVKEIIKKALSAGDGTYKGILEPLNIIKEDYKKFLNFLNDNKLK